MSDIKLEARSEVSGGASEAGGGSGRLPGAMARLFCGDSKAVPTHIGFCYSNSAGLAYPESPASVADVTQGGFVVYHAPIAGRSVSGSAVSFHASTAGSMDAADYSAPAGLSGYSLVPGYNAVVYGALLLSGDGTVLDAVSFSPAKPRPADFELSMTWRIDFS